MQQAMASKCDFEAALSYALKCIGKEGLKLKAEQREVVREVYDGNDVFGYLRDLESLSASSVSLSCST